MEKNKNFNNEIGKFKQNEDIIKKILVNPKIIDDMNPEELENIVILLEQKKEQLGKENIRLKKEIELKDKYIEKLKAKKQG